MSFTKMHLYFDDVEVGQEWESPARTITETDIVNFAGLSGDFGAIHVDQEFAKKTPFRKTIAHGLLGFSIGTGLGMYAPPMRTVAFLEIREWFFRGAIFAGDTVRLRTRVVEKDVRARGRRAVIAWHRTLLNQEDKVMMEGITVTLVQGRASERAEKSTGVAAEKPDATVDGIERAD